MGFSLTSRCREAASSQRSPGFLKRPFHPPLRKLHPCIQLTHCLQVSHSIPPQSTALLIPRNMAMADTTFGWDPPFSFLIGKKGPSGLKLTELWLLTLFQTQNTTPFSKSIVHPLVTQMSITFQLSSTCSRDLLMPTGA